ncbi:MAG: outer membrane beta-barrel protein [Candidatus Eisenbacteria sp.]|nr:outer membrane beta-barrel protein [Candidatus Eisenbacteria bacterium]
MRPGNSHMPAVVALLVAAVVLAATVVDASGALPGRGWRSTRYGRKGAEISVEFPRVLYATGAGYSGDYDVTEGLGFGFGMMWGISDNIAFEGRMLQSNHTTGVERSEWDIDLIKVGGRYTFMEEYRFQPFVGTGWAKMTFERDMGSDSPGSFERLTGYGAYVAIGVDYIHSGAWSGFFRADYTYGGYGHQIIGVEEESLDKPRSGNCVSMTLGLAYRIPAW